MADSWCVDAELQRQFAALSGDHNPIHVDESAARRTRFGRVTVHGLHLVLDALERVAAGGLTPVAVRATFRHPVAVGDELTTDLGQAGTTVTATVTTDVWRAADITVETSMLSATTTRPTTLPVPGRRIPELRTVDDVAGAAGVLDTELDVTLATQRFPRLVDAIGAAALAELATLTRLVGMHVPGRHALFSALDVTLGEGDSDAGVRFRVRDVDDRFRRVTIEVEGAAVAGTVTAFVDRPPVEQMLTGVRPLPDEFAGQRWLVVGGSRGLGAMAVLLLADGGAEVCFTYRESAGEAAGLAERVGGRAIRFDVDDLDNGLAGLGDWRPTHLAYMATPPIFDGASGVYSQRLFARLRRVYVDRFGELVARLGDELAGIVWPSTVAAGNDVAGLAEYADAKRAGEALCRRLAVERPGLRLSVPRLPRLLTDQTTSFVPVEYGDAAAEVLAALRATVPPART